MSSVYLKCDGCGAILDRYPKEMQPNDGSFGKFGGGHAKAYARSIGWECSEWGEPEKDFCPSCVKNEKARHGCP